MVEGRRVGRVERTVVVVAVVEVVVHIYLTCYIPSLLPCCLLCSLLLWDFALHLCCGIVRHTTTTTAYEYGKSTEGRLIGGTTADAVLLTWFCET